ncbi:uncharacterized protein [Solanum lycopersicum]|uniref:NAC domain-containing protein n=1 Tax=Solanum lycopersicum TaxID=4081 RepID=A0A3Q7F292_SOLLC|nr:uncharacterized protein LOC101263670 [Solanum lycopersicum]
MDKINEYWKSTDKNMMDYVIDNKPFPHKHTIMKVDDIYGIRMFTPSQIFQSTEEPKNKNVRYLITNQKNERARSSAYKDSRGVWKFSGKIDSIFDPNKRLLGYVKISRWFYYYGEKNKRIIKSEWHMREYYVTPTINSRCNVDKKGVIFVMMFKNQKRNDNDNNIDQDDETPGQLDDHQDFVANQITQSLQGIHL